MGALDWGIMLAYAGVVLWIGWSVGRRSGPQAREFMVAGRTIPAWAALCSLIATELSAATFMGVPHAAYTGDWSYLQILIGSIVGRIVVAVFLLQLYFRLDLVTVYGLLGERFGPLSQRCAACLFLVGRVLGSGVRLFIAALAFATITGFSIEWSVILAGTVAGLYARAGGIRAVIWTDVLQGAVFLTAAVAVLVAISGHLNGGLSGMWSAASSADKLTVIHWPAARAQELLTAGTPADGVWLRLADAWQDFVARHLSSTSALPGALVGGFFLTLAAQGTDQDLVQRLLTTRDGRSGGAALIASGFLSVPIVAVFLAVGTGLWALYTPELGLALPDAGAFTAPVDDKRVLPSFALHHLPDGLRGLVFAGLFAAAMSSLDSAVNALATSWVVDIRRGGERGATSVDVATLRRATLAFTAVLIASALVFIAYERATRDGASGLNLVELALAAMSVVYGGLLGSFLVALLTPRFGTDRSVTAGMLVGALVGVLLFLQPFWSSGHTIAWPWWIASGAFVAFVIGVTRPRAEPKTPVVATP